MKKINHILIEKERILLDFCNKKGWDIKNITEDQLNIVQRTPEWKDLAFKYKLNNTMSDGVDTN